MKKLISLLLVLNSFATYAIDDFIDVLSCNASDDNEVSFIISKSEDTYFLKAVKNGSVSKIEKLTTWSGDMGYLSYEFEVSENRVGDFVNAYSIYVYNNEEDIDNPEDAIITGGEIENEAGDVYYECMTLGEHKI